MSWFTGKRHFPPPVKFEIGKPKKVVFNEKTVRRVGGKYRKEFVIDVQIPPARKKQSLFLSHTDLQRRIALLEEKHGSLLNIKAEITLVEKVIRVGNPWYKYQVIDMTDGQFID